MSKLTRDTDKDAPLGDDLIWSVKSIAQEIGRPERYVFYMVSTGQLPAAKIGGRIVASRRALRAFFTAALGGVTP